MATGKVLGKIDTIRFGIGGYQDACIGVHVNIKVAGGGVSDSKSFWDKNRIEHTSNSKWSEYDRSEKYAEIVSYLSDLMHSAKVDSIDKLKGIPVEAEFEGMDLVSWRVLTEVL